MSELGNRIIHLMEQGHKRPEIAVILGVTPGQLDYHYRKATGGEAFMEHERRRQRRASGTPRARSATNDHETTVDLVTKVLFSHDYVGIEVGLNDGYVATVGNATSKERPSVDAAIREALKRADNGQRR